MARHNRETRPRHHQRQRRHRPTPEDVGVSNGIVGNSQKPPSRSSAWADVACRHEAIKSYSNFILLFISVTLMASWTSSSLATETTSAHDLSKLSNKPNNNNKFETSQGHNQMLLNYSLSQSQSQPQQPPQPPPLPSPLPSTSSASPVTSLNQKQQAARSQVDDRSLLSPQPPRITSHTNPMQLLDKCQLRRSCRATARSRMLDVDAKKQSCTCDQACVQ